MSLTPGAYDPRFMKPARLCRCGHILDCCADCMGWLREHSPRIVRAWRWTIDHPQFTPAAQELADYEERAAIAAYARPVAEPCGHCGHSRYEHDGDGMCRHLAYANGARCGCARFQP